MYYKIYRGNEILDAISNPFYFYRLPNRRITSCSRKEAEGVLSQDGSTKWFIEAWIKQNFVQNACSIIEITANEYELLREALDQKKVVEDTEGEAIIVSPSEAASNTIKEGKIAIMNKSCSEKIVEGVDVVLSDGQNYHFDLTIEDQINLLSLQNLINEGYENVPYHAKGKEAKMFSSADIKKILTAVNKHRLYHLTYVNVLKNYIQHLNDLNQLASVYYGMPIPEEYQTEVFKSLLK